MKFFRFSSRKKTHHDIQKKPEVTSEDETVALAQVRNASTASTPSQKPRDRRRKRIETKSPQDESPNHRTPSGKILPKDPQMVMTSTESNTASTESLVQERPNEYPYLPSACPLVQYSPPSVAEFPQQEGIEYTTVRKNEIIRQAADYDKRGNTLFERGRYDDAFVWYEKAHALKREHLGEMKDQSNFMASMATSINNITYLKQRSGQATLAETMEEYMKSLKIKRDILGPDHLSVGKTLNNIGSVFYLQTEYEPALQAYTDAQRIMAQHLGEQALDVGTVLSNIGDVHVMMAKAANNEDTTLQYKEKALIEYRKALDIRWQGLGRGDPKVVRLMEQIAQLETGTQPVKDHEHESDSEHEDFAIEDRQKHESFQEEVRILQQELREDLKWMVVLEKKMEIDMVKEKARIFREMRLQFNSFSDDSERGTPLANKIRARIESREQTDVAETPVTRVLFSEDSSHGADDDHTDDVRLSPFASEAVSKENSSFKKSSIHQTPTTHNENQAYTIRSSVASRMSTEQRQKALSSVKDRLAQLRARRDERFERCTPVPSVRPTVPISHTMLNTSSLDVHASVRRILEQHEREMDDVRLHSVPATS